jgi:hypothetical protein
VLTLAPGRTVVADLSALPLPSNLCRRLSPSMQAHWAALQRRHAFKVPMRQCETEGDDAEVVFVRFSSFSSSSCPFLAPFRTASHPCLGRSTSLPTHTLPPSSLFPFPVFPLTFPCVDGLSSRSVATPQVPADHATGRIPAQVGAATAALDGVSRRRKREIEKATQLRFLTVSVSRVGLPLLPPRKHC